MADRASVAKSLAYVVTGQDEAVKVTKVVAYLLLVPGAGEDTSNRQGHVHPQILRRG